MLVIFRPLNRSISVGARSSPVSLFLPPILFAQRALLFGWQCPVTLPLPLHRLAFRGSQFQKTVRAMVQALPLFQRIAIPLFAMCSQQFTLAWAQALPAFRARYAADGKA
jgi:hypothetical protein